MTPRCWKVILKKSSMNTQGAVFIFAEHNNQMKLTQKILMSEKSFGLRWAVVIFLSLFLLLRLSPDRPDKTMTVPGLGVGAPEVKNYDDGDVLKSCWHSFMKIPYFTAIFQEAKAFYLKIRPTVVFKLKPKVSLPYYCSVNTFLVICGIKCFFHELYC